MKISKPYILCNFQPASVKDDFSFATVSKQSYSGEILEKNIGVFKNNDKWYFLKDGNPVDEQIENLERLYHARKALEVS